MGIETSCDETAVGIVDGDRNILADMVATQFDEHRPYGGVVPEIAARAHLDKLDELIVAAMDKAKISFDDLSGVAATCGPGLIGGVMVGAMTAKAISAVRDLPFVAVNHLEAHALTARLTHGAEFPYLLLLVSGGHSQLLLVRGVGDYRRLGTTIDDAAGECFDKSAKLLGLGYPGGPMLEKAAANGDENAFDLPHPMRGREGCDFSFSGLKTAVRQKISDEISRVESGRLDQKFISGMAASLQRAIAEILADRTQNAFSMLENAGEKVTALVAAGGVAANKAVGRKLSEAASKNGVVFIAPPPSLCTDNGVMVAWAGLERLRLGKTDGLSFPSRPRWPLDLME